MVTKGPKKNEKLMRPRIDQILYFANYWIRRSKIPNASAKSWKTESYTKIKALKPCTTGFLP